MPASATPSDPERPWLDRYPPGIPRSIEIPSQRLPDAIEESVHRWPRRAALEFYGRSTTYEALWAESGRFAGALYREGVRPGDRIGLFLPNCPAHPVALLGALRLGATAAQLSPLYRSADLSGVLADAKLRAIVLLDIHLGNLDAVAEALRPPLRIVARLREFYPWFARPFVNRVARRRGLVPMEPAGPGIRHFSEMVRSREVAPSPRSDPAREVAVLQYTGGTTGRPIAAMLTHRNLLANALQCKAYFPTVPDGTGTLLAAIPFFHSYGLTVALHYPLLAGRTIVLMLRPEVPEMLRLIAKHRPVELPGVPALYRGIAESPEVRRYDIRSIRVCVSGSAPLAMELAERFEAITGGSLVEGYGLSEASPVTHANPVDRRYRRAGSIGLPVPGTDQRIVDLEDGTTPVPIGTAGELCVRGPQVMLGYFGHPEETARALRDGWLFTGDVARLDAEGYAYVVDRKKDMIDVGGFKVYPREVEELLGEMPGVAEAAVIGVPDPALGEVVKAFVVRRPGAELGEAAVIEFVRARLAHYKAPRSVEFRESLPRSGIQKLLRRELRAPVAEPGTTGRAG